MDIIVFKIGGSIHEELPDEFYQTIVQLKESGRVHPVIVHGGGPGINQALEKMNVKTEFVDGLRVTTKEVLNVAELVMSGRINKEIVTKVHKNGGTALGLSGVDGQLLQAKPVPEADKLGFVGEVAKVNVEWLHLIIENNAIPVISPIGIDEFGEHYNINGDMASASVARALKAKLALVSDIPGVMEEIDGKQIVHSQLTKQQVEEKIREGVIYGGMIPKVRSALQAVEDGVQESVILNGLEPKDIQAYCKEEDVGTKILLKELQHV